MKIDIYAVAQQCKMEKPIPYIYDNTIQYLGYSEGEPYSNASGIRGQVYISSRYLYYSYIISKSAGNFINEMDVYLHECAHRITHDLFGYYYSAHDVLFASVNVILLFRMGMNVDIYEYDIHESSYYYTKLYGKYRKDKTENLIKISRNLGIKLAQTNYTVEKCARILHNKLSLERKQYWIKQNNTEYIYDVIIVFIASAMLLSEVLAIILGIGGLL